MHKEILKHLESSELAFQHWKRIPFSDRQVLLRSLAELLREGKQKYALLISNEMNKPISQSLAEIEKCVGLIDYYADIENVLAPEMVETEFSISEICHEPMGVILGIMPWNFPFWQVLRFAIPAILAGNAVVLKHASICLDSGNAVAELFSRSGFPSGLFQHLELTHSEVEYLLSQPIIKAVSLTGSEVAGRKIAEIAGKYLKKCVLELGGNDAFIVLEDADLLQAAKDAAWARLQNCGQTCVAGKRFIVHRGIYDQFIDLFLAEYKKYVSGNVLDETTFFSKMSRKDLASELYVQYEKALAQGGQILLPLIPIDELTFEPGLLLMQADFSMADEEFFGPLGMVFIAEDDAHALALANATRFGLANAVYTRNKAKAVRFANELESGSVAINQIFRSDVRLPFGGRKDSGYGVEMSHYTLHEFTVKKSIFGEF